jgi:hypothetical protein
MELELEEAMELYVFCRKVRKRQKLQRQNYTIALSSFFV